MNEKKPKPLSLKTKRKAKSLGLNTKVNAPIGAKPKRPLSLKAKKRVIIKKSPSADISRTFANAENQSKQSTAAPTSRRTLKKKRRIINTNLGQHYTQKKATWKKKPVQVQAKKIPPSKIKAQQLEALLSERFEAWRTHQPLQLGIERQIFQLIGAEHLPYSKRVVQKVLSRHTRSREYLENTLRMNTRVSLQNTVSGDIQEKDKSYAKEKVSTIKNKIEESIK